MKQRHALDLVDAGTLSRPGPIGRMVLHAGQLSAVIATPGYGMRSIPELFGRIGGTPAQEHRCPGAFINGIDAWERQRPLSHEQRR